MRIVAISDTHGLHKKMDPLPDGDVLIHCGDFTNIGRIQEIVSFNAWIKKQKFDYKLVLAGNHDLLFDKEPTLAESFLTDCTYLRDSSYIINGIKFYGSPWQNRFMDWAFNLPTDGEEIEYKFSLIPDDVNVLITHSPPYRILDKEGFRCLGSKRLLERVKDLKLMKYHVFGHIHAGRGVYPEEDPIFANCSICDEHYNVINKPIVLEI
jgi:Icc-related predicted phosphoesterase